MSQTKNHPSSTRKSEISLHTRVKQKKHIFHQPPPTKIFQFPENHNKKLQNNPLKRKKMLNPKKPNKTHGLWLIGILIIGNHNH